MPAPYVVHAAWADLATTIADTQTREHGATFMTPRLHRKAATAHLIAIDAATTSKPEAVDGHVEAVLRHWGDANHLAAHRANVQRVTRLARANHGFFGHVEATD